MGKPEKAKEELKLAVDIFSKLGIKHGQDKSLKVLLDLAKLMEKGTLAGVGPGNQDAGQ
jgi:hypothetical protein